MQFIVKNRNVRQISAYLWENTEKGLDAQQALQAPLSLRL